MRVQLFTSSFCEPCISTRKVLDRAVELVPAASVTEINVAFDTEAAEQAAIRVTPTVIVESDDGTEVFRAEGVPTLDQALSAFARAL